MSEEYSFSYELSPFLPFRDAAACARARSVSRDEITTHSNPKFHIAIIDDAMAFYRAFADDLVERIRIARDAGKQFVAILPCGPVPQYRIAAELINREELGMSHVHTFNMDEYANQDGITAPISWIGSFQRAMWEQFFSLIDERLRPPVGQIHFPETTSITSYSERIEQLGGADICYGGIGWSGHIAFWEPQLGFEFAGDFDAYKAAGARIVELHPMTIMQNALHSFGSDWSSVPPRAATIGPKEILGARHRSFWLDGAFTGGVSWQQFIARLVAHGPVSEFVPGSLLQTTSGDYTMLGAVADDIEVHMA